MAIESGSQWTLTGDATVGELQVLNSGVALSDGSGRFNALTVDGDLHSEGATFLFQGRWPAMTARWTACTCAATPPATR